MTLQHTTAAAIFLCCLSPPHIRSKMSSGVKVADSVTIVYSDMKLLKNDPMAQIRLVILGFVDDNIDVVHKFLEKDLVEKDQDAFTVFKSFLKEDACHYILYDCRYDTVEATGKKEIVFVSWCPDSAHIKLKMKYASSKDYLMRALSGLKHKIHFSETADCSGRACFAGNLGKDVIKLEGIDLSCTQQRSVKGP